jgi:hypothetical protein
MFHTIRNGVAHACAKATPKRFALDIDSIHLFSPRLRHLERFRERFFGSDKMFLQYMLFEEILAREGPFVHVLSRQLGIDIMQVEMAHFVDMVVTEHTFSVRGDDIREHVDPFGIVVAMDAQLMSLPAICVSE